MFKCESQIHGQTDKQTDYSYFIVMIFSFVENLLVNKIIARLSHAKIQVIYRNDWPFIPVNCHF